MNKNNLEIREAIAKNKLRYWQVAYRLGLNDGNFSRLLRKELTNDKKEIIFQIIAKLKEEQENE